MMTNQVTTAARALLIALALGAVSATADAKPKARAPRPMTMMATAYCDGGTTKSGTQAVSGTAAADPAVLPIGTVIRFVPPGRVRAQTFTVADTGAAVKGREVDVFIADCARAKRFGRKQVLVTVVRPASVAENKLAERQ